MSSVFVSTALTDAYAKANYLELVLDVLDEMPHGNKVSWTTLIASLARVNRWHNALFRFVEMRPSAWPTTSMPARPSSRRAPMYDYLPDDVVFPLPI